MKFRKKPVVIEAFQMTLDRMLDLAKTEAEWPDWLNEAWNLPSGTRNAFTCHLTESTRRFAIFTLEGEHTVSPEDWIIRGVKGELYPCRFDIFEMTYEPVADIADLIQNPPASGAELDAALSTVTLTDIADAAATRANTQQDHARVMREALLLTGCKDVDEWLRVFGQLCSPDVVNIWLPLLQPIEPN